MNFCLQKSLRRHYAEVLLFFLVLAMAITVWHLEPMLSRDGTFYAGMIWEKIQKGVPFCRTGCYIPPFFSLCAYGFCRLTGISAGYSLQILNTIFLGLMVFPMTAIARRILHSSAAAFFCAAWLVTSPVLFQTVRGGTREPLFLLCILVSAAAALHSRGRYYLVWQEISAAFGIMALLTRYEGGGWLIFSLIYVTFFAKSTSSWIQCLMRGLLFIVLAMLSLGILCLLSSEIALFSGEMIKRLFNVAAKIL